MHEEEILGKAYDAALMKRLLKHLKPYTRYVLGAIVLSILVSALEAVRPYFTKIAVDDNIAQGDKHGLLMTILIFLRRDAVPGCDSVSEYLPHPVDRATYDLRPADGSVRAPAAAWCEIL